METFSSTEALQEKIRTLKAEGKQIAFVPTMGALHAGHQALIVEAKKIADICVASVFVNPTQFNDKKDYDIYPRTVNEDKKKLEEVGCDILFLPSEDEMYKNPKLEVSTTDIGYLDTVLEGEKRPGHYQGVVTIVEKLLKAVQPDYLIMGLKDYQQVMVVRKMIYDKGLSVELIGVDTIRERNGLAMSSRNARLSEDGKNIASQIHAALKFIAEHKGEKTLQEIIEESQELYLDDCPFDIEYLEVYNQKELKPITASQWYTDTPMVALAAIWLEGVRLIDNIEF